MLSLAPMTQELAKIHSLQPFQETLDSALQDRIPRGAGHPAAAICPVRR